MLVHRIHQKVYPYVSTIDITCWLITYLLKVY